MLRSIATCLRKPNLGGNAWEFDPQQIADSKHDDHGDNTTRHLANPFFDVFENERPKGTADDDETKKKKPSHGVHIAAKWLSPKIFEVLPHGLDLSRVGQREPKFSLAVRAPPQSGLVSGQRTGLGNLIDQGKALETHQQAGNSAV